ncbi:MAG: hypothetical protein AAB681_01745 [Patescibacteria group bacterium]
MSYVILEHIYKISNSLNDKPHFFAYFSLSSNKNSTLVFEEKSVEGLAKAVREQIDLLKMSRDKVEATFDNTRKYSDRGGTIKYQSPFSESEEKVFLQVLMEPRSE